MSLTGIAALVGGLLLLGCIGEGVLLKRSYEAQGALQQSNTALISTVKAMNEAQRQRDAIHGTNEALPDDQLFKDLLK